MQVSLVSSIINEAGNIVVGVDISTTLLTHYFC